MGMQTLCALFITNCHVQFCRSLTKLVYKTKQTTLHEAQYAYETSLPQSLSSPMQKTVFFSSGNIIVSCYFFYWFNEDFFFFNGDKSYMEYIHILITLHLKDDKHVQVQCLDSYFTSALLLLSFFFRLFHLFLFWNKWIEKLQNKIIIVELREVNWQIQTKKLFIILIKCINVTNVFCISFYFHYKKSWSNQ